MYCQCLDAAVLQLFGQCGDDELLLVPSQTGFHRDRQADGLYHLLGDFEHLRNVLQHTGTRTFASHFLHRAAKVEVNQVGAGLFYDFCRLDHGLYVTPIDLNAHRALVVADGQFLDGRLHIAYQCLGTDKLGIDHRGAKPLAEQAETNVGDVFHRSQQDGLFAQIDISYFHPFEFSIAIVVFLAGHVSHVTSLWVGTRAAPPTFFDAAKLVIFWQNTCIGKDVLACKRLKTKKRDTCSHRHPAAFNLYIPKRETYSIVVVGCHEDRDDRRAYHRDCGFAARPPGTSYIARRS